jgi:hypothetical protein
MGTISFPKLPHINSIDVSKGFSCSGIRNKNAKSTSVETIIKWYIDNINVEIKHVHITICFHFPNYIPHFV